MNISEIEAAQDEAAACQQLADAVHDVVLFDTRMPAERRRALLDAVRATAIR